MVALFLCSQPYAAAQSPQTVQWGGVSLAGEFAQLPRLMPTLHELLTTEEFKQRFHVRATQAVVKAAASHPSLRILVNEQISQEDDSYALTFALSGESVTSITMEQATYVDYVVQALLLVANVSKDPDRQRIVSSYPVGVRYTHAYPDGRKPDPRDRKAIIAGMLMGEMGKADLVDAWQTRLGEVSLRERDEWIAVAPLKILPDAQRQGGFTKDQADAVSFRVSSVVEGNISRAADIPIVPSTFDGALETLTLSFANRGVLAFRKPNPSYLLQVSIYGLGSNRVQEAMTRERQFAVAYGGGFQVDYFSVDPDRRLTNELSMRLQSVQSVTYIGTTEDARRASDADMFSRLIAAFADEMSSNLIPADRRWFEKYKASSEPKSGREMARLVAAKLPGPAKPAAVAAETSEIPSIFQFLRGQQ
jgi:hypothetical protein